MRELFTTLFVFAAAFMLWRALRPHQPRGYELAHGDTTLQFPPADEAGFKWPALGKFEFAVIEAASHQGALKRIAETAAAGPKGLQCTATLHMGEGHRHVYKPVEVRIQGQRVAFLSSGDASRFQRRRAYEGRAGQTTACDAVIVEVTQGARTSLDVRLDLKEFRH